MPLLQVYLLEGRPAEKKRELLRRLTETTAEVLGAPPESIRVLVHEMSPDDWSVAGETMRERRR